MMRLQPTRSRAGTWACRAAALGLLLLAAACQEPVSREIPGRDLGGLRLLYRAPLEGISDVVAVSTDGERIYADVNRRIEAFDPATGARLWSYQRPLGGPSLVVPRAGRVFFVGDTAVALEAATGRELWRYVPDAFGGFCESDGDADAFYFGTETRLYALRASDGALLWSRDVGADWEHGGVVRGMTVSGDTVYAVVEHHTGINGYIGIGEVFALDRRTGDVLWNYSNGDGSRLSISQSAVRVTGRLLVGVANWENEIFAVDRFTGREVWRVRAEFGYFGAREAPEVEGETGYAASADISIRAIDLRTGELRWTSRVMNGASYIAVCGNRVLVEDLAISVLDRSTGRLLARAYEGGPNFPQTDFLVIGDRAYTFTGNALLAFRCPE